ncbi:MAG TPA: flagellar filament capping protein FliD [Candidatus Aquilonibacter sp.]|nr:flagellar filament capping protein FliD [Candidatus Aquilonibacter sp.]
MSSTSSIGSSLIAGSQSTSSSGGLGAGIDVSTLVQASMADQNAELQQMQNQQSTITGEQNALNTINNDVQTLSNAVFTLTDPAGQLTDVASTSSDSSVLTASAISGATSGNAAIVVNSLATTSSEYSAAVATSSTAIATGTLQIQVGSNTPATITIDNTDNTLDGLASAINDANIGVTASVIDDANGARLAIVSNTSGAPGDLTITPSSGALTFTKAVTGANASLTVNGIPISSTTNTVTGAIPGVTLNLNSANPDETVNLTTGPDVTQQEDAINSFVSAYNTVVTDLNNQFQVSSSTNEPGPLQADSTLALAQDQLLQAMSFTMTGNGSVNGLADLGITMNNDGTLSVDSSTLEGALQSDPNAVQSFFNATQSGGFGNNLYNQVQAIADPVNGSIAQDITGLQQSQSDITQQISDFQDQLTTQEQQLTQEYDQVDVTLQELPLLLQQVNQQLSSLGSS